MSEKKQTLFPIGIRNVPLRIGIPRPKDGEDLSWLLAVTGYDILYDNEDYSLNISLVQVDEIPDTNYVDVTVLTNEGSEPEGRRWILYDREYNVVRDWQDSPLFEGILRNQELVAVVEDDWDKGDVAEFVSNPSTQVDEQFDPTHEVGAEGEIQEFTVPTTGEYEITAYGAEGGYASGNEGPAGKGAMMKAKVLLEEGDKLLIVVGQMGEENGSGGGQAGGGGTFIVKVVEHSDYQMFDNRYVVPLLVAGGGSGAPNTSVSGTFDGRIDTRGYEYQSVGHTNNSGAGGGGGFTQAGGGNSAHWGQSFLSGAKGGAITGWAEGGFGCAGGKGSDYNDGAGGGGFDGGDHTYEEDQGGGGSFIAENAELLDSEAGIREGAGLCEIDAGIAGSYEEEPTKITEVNIYENESSELYAEAVVDTLFPEGLEFQLEDTQENVLVGWQASNEFGPLVENNDYVVRVKDVNENEDSQQFTVFISVYEEFEATSTEHDGTIQTFEAPVTGDYQITAFGAGWGIEHQLGAKIKGIFSLTEGERLDLLVGQLANNAWSGCGGTFVVKENGNTNEDILVIAGGSGGYTSGDPQGASHGQAGTAGGRSSGTTAVADNGDGGVQNGATWAGSGAGFFGDGEGSDGTVAQAYINGGYGQISEVDARGGYGGGGTGRHDERLGGGGGYSGGTSHGEDHNAEYAGGGGSYNSGTDQQNEAGINEGHGKVIIERVG